MSFVATAGLIEINHSSVNPHYKTLHDNVRYSTHALPARWRVGAWKSRNVSAERRRPIADACIGAFRHAARAPDLRVSDTRSSDR